MSKHITTIDHAGGDFVIITYPGSIGTFCFNQIYLSTDLHECAIIMTRSAQINIF
ncbi:MAG: hypothetical protein PVI99_01535 [Anaerolineales bacterium]